MLEFKMPSLGADMESGTLIEWKVKPGDSVKHGDIIAVVGTEKGEIDVEIFNDGIVDQLVVSQGAEVPVGALLAMIRAEGEKVEMVEKVAVKEVPAEKVAVAEQIAEHHPMDQRAVIAKEAAPKEMGGRENGHRIRVSPLARRLAEELGIDLNTVTGTGHNGAIERHDVEAIAKLKETAKPVALPAPAKPVEVPTSKPAETAPVEAAPIKPAGDFATAMRTAIAKAMARSNREIPHYYLQQRIDMSKALQWLEAENQKRSIKDRVLPVVLLIKAVAKSLVEIPQLNGYWIDDQLQPQEGIHIGFAIALRQGGLITPAIHDADIKTMDELMEAMRDLIMRTRAGRLRSSEMTDATITLTNLGDLGVETVYGVIYPPQVALVGMGKIVDQPWVENGMIGVRPVLTATLAGDHRATDGRTGGQFLDILNRKLQEPGKLWE